MVDGFLIIDKPAGITSHTVVNRVRRMLGTKKVGHTGTLDPFATGVLPVAVGETTKTIQFLDESHKEYLATVRLGISTDTLDITGNLLETLDCSTVTSAQLTEVMASFTGEISQLPPMYSAIKQGGQPLYKLARKGLEVERSPRQVTIHRFELISYEPPDARVLVACSRGTYVRSLAADLGAKLGCGACLSELRRTRSGMFRLEAALTLEQAEELVEQGKLAEQTISISQVLQHLPLYRVDERQASMLRNGVVPRVLECSLQHGLMRFVFADDVIAVAELDQSGYCRIKRVFNQPSYR